jgi:hypothetical protein
MPDYKSKMDAVAASITAMLQKNGFDVDSYLSSERVLRNSAETYRLDSQYLEKSGDAKTAAELIEVVQEFVLKSFDLTARQSQSSLLKPVADKQMQCKSEEVKRAFALIRALYEDFSATTLKHSPQSRTALSMKLCARERAILAETLEALAELKLKAEAGRVKEARRIAVGEGKAVTVTRNVADTRKGCVDAFLQRIKDETQISRPTRKLFWLAAGHKTARQFQYWQSDSKKSTDADRQNFHRLLQMNPKEFEALVNHRNLLS